MKKLSIRIVLLLFIVAATATCLRIWVFPHLFKNYWSRGAPLVSAKAKLLEQTPGKFNTLFIGSSRVFRQIDPHVVDSVASTRSFNFGVNWLFVPESFYVYDHLLREEKNDCNIVVMELSKIRSVDYSNLHATRTIYWYSTPLYFFSVRAIWGSVFSLTEKLALTAIHTLSFADWILNLGDVTTLADSGEESGRSNIPPFRDNGYAPLEVVSKKREQDDEDVNDRHRMFLRDTSVVTRRKEVSGKSFSRFEEDPQKLNEFNRSYATELNRMIGNASRKGIRLIFLLSPRIDAHQYAELIPLWNALPAKNRIEISDARIYPELYLAENSFDETHLNAKGARYYSTLLGEKIRALVQVK